MREQGVVLLPDLISRLTPWTPTDVHPDDLRWQNYWISGDGPIPVLLKVKLGDQLQADKTYSLDVSERRRKERPEGSRGRDRLELKLCAMDCPRLVEVSLVEHGLDSVLDVRGPGLIKALRFRGVRRAGALVLAHPGQEVHTAIDGVTRCVLETMKGLVRITGARIVERKYNALKLVLETGEGTLEVYDHRRGLQSDLALIEVIEQRSSGRTFRFLNLKAFAGPIEEATHILTEEGIKPR